MTRDPVSHDVTPAGAIDAKSVPGESRTGYPPPLAVRVAGRERRRLGEVFGLKNFGVNLTRLAPGSESALLHRHSRQDEFVYVLAGAPTLITESGESVLQPGMCAGFAAGGQAHHLVNRTGQDVWFLEVGDRAAADAVVYPEDDLGALLQPDGHWLFTHRDGRPY